MNIIDLRPLHKSISNLLNELTTKYYSQKWECLNCGETNRELLDTNESDYCMSCAEIGAH